MTLSITSFGAVGDGRTDNTAAIQACFNQAKATGQDVYIPAGVFNHSGVLRMDGIKVAGAGAESTLFATNAKAAAIFMTGSGSDLSNVKVATNAGSRLDTLENNAVSVDGATNFKIHNITIDKSNAAGIHVHGASVGEIYNNTINNTNADSIHMSNASISNGMRASHDIKVYGNRIDKAGDDGISVVSYNGNAGLNYNITVEDNTVTNNVWGRGYTVVGGHDVTIQNNYFSNNEAKYAGIYIASEGSYGTGEAYNIKVLNNTVKDAGGNHGAIHLFADASALDLHNVTVSGNQVYNARSVPIVLNGSDGNYDNTITNNKFYGSNGETVALNDGARDNTVSNNSLQSLSAYPGDLNKPDGGIDYTPPTTTPTTPPAPTPPTTPTEPAPSEPTPSEPTPSEPAPPTAQVDNVITVRVSGDAYKGDAVFRLMVDGKQVGADTKVTADHRAGEWQDIKFHTDFAPDAKKVSVVFTNDAWGGDYTKDRNMYVQSIDIDGKSLTPDKTGLFHSNVGATVSIPQDEIKVRVSGDAYQGSPKFKLLADGVQIGSDTTVTASHKAGAWQEFTFKATLNNSDPHVGLKFFNDLYGGNANADRNLYVDYITVNGHKVDVADASYHVDGGADLAGQHLINSNGTLDFHFDPSYVHDVA